MVHRWLAPVQWDGSSLDPAETTTFDVAWPWQPGNHTLRFEVDPVDSIVEVSELNNAIEDRTNTLSVGFWVEQSVYDWFNANQVSLGLGSVPWEDWAHRQLCVWNQMFADAITPFTPQGILDRVRLDEVTVVTDGALPPCTTSFPVPGTAPHSLASAARTRPSSRTASPPLQQPAPPWNHPPHTHATTPDLLRTASPRAFARGSPSGCQIPPPQTPETKPPIRTASPPLQQPALRRNHPRHRHGTTPDLTRTASPRAFARGIHGAPPPHAPTADPPSPRAFSSRFGYTGCRFPPARAGPGTVAEQGEGQER
jgi:hypothetical protein